MMTARKYFWFAIIFWALAVYITYKVVTAWDDDGIFGNVFLLALDGGCAIFGTADAWIYKNERKSKHEEH